MSESKYTPRGEVKKSRKSIAPQEEGELPNENRCPRCFTLLSKLEKDEQTLVDWCVNCRIVY